MKAIITGASSGIGKEIAKILSLKGYETLLIARNETKLREVSKEITSSRVLAADLSTKTGVSKIMDFCDKENFTPNILINNAGIGLGETFQNQKLDKIEGMMNLNMNSLVRLCHNFIPQMLALPKSYILNVASTSAYQAMPGFAVYAASKAFVLNFSRALYEELEGTNLHVTTLTPGPTKSNFIKNADIEFLEKQAEKFEMSAEDVASQAINGMFKGKKEVVPGLMNSVSTKVIRVLPRSISEGVVKKMYLK